MNSDEQFKKKISKSIVIEALKKNVRLIYKEQISKKTRRINTSGLFFCSLCGDELGDECSDELNFNFFKF
jgi:hypothetical protein